MRGIAQPFAFVRIPGMTVELVPPAGFQPSRQFSGFEAPQTGSAIIVLELPVPQSEAPAFLAQLTTAELLRSKGMQLKATQDISLGGYPGKLLLVSQMAYGVPYLKWIAVTTTGDRALLVNAPFFAFQATEQQEPLRQAILGLRWQPNSPVQKLEGLPFTVQLAGDLQISDRISNTILLTRKGAKPPIPASEPLLAVEPSYRPIVMGGLANFSRQRLQALSEVSTPKETAGQSKTIAGYPAFELTADGYDLKTKLPVTVYQVILNAGETYYIVHGIVGQTEAAAYLPVFRAIADSLVPRP